MPPFPFLALVPLHSIKISEWSWICSWHRWYGRLSYPSSSPRWWRRPPPPSSTTMAQTIPNPLHGSILFLPCCLYLVLHHELLQGHISKYAIFIWMPLVLFNTVDSDASDNVLYALALAVMSIPSSLLMTFPTLDVFLLQWWFVLQASSGLMSPMPFPFASLGYGLWKLCLFVFLNLRVRLLRPASLTWGMDRQAHERLWIAGVTGHRADSLDKPGPVPPSLYESSNIW